MALKAIREGINLPLSAGLKIEQDISFEIMQSPTAANLISVFFKGNTVDRDPGIDLQVHPREKSRESVSRGGSDGGWYRDSPCSPWYSGCNGRYRRRAD